MSPELGSSKQPLAWLIFPLRWFQSISVALFSVLFEQIAISKLIRNAFSNSLLCYVRHVPPSQPALRSFMSTLASAIAIC